jgi:hypothetical protein
VQKWVNELGSVLFFALKRVPKEKSGLKRVRIKMPVPKDLDSQD